MTPELGCLKKRFYDTEYEASAQAAVQREYSGHDNIYAYKCKFCNGWHIGHYRQHGKKVIKRKPPQ